MGKHVLIVDADKKLVHFLRVSLESLDSGHEVNSFDSAEEALRAMKDQPCDLLITAYSLPGLDGLELIREACQIYPRMLSVLMVSEESPEVEKAARELQVYEYLVKPFSVTGLMSRIQEASKDEIPALVESGPPEGEKASGEAIPRTGMITPTLPRESFEAISSVLKELRSEIAAQCVLLTDILGGVITTAGVTEDLDVTALASLSAGGYASILEMSRRLDEEDALNLNFHEGKHYDIYSCNIGDGYLLMIICDRRICASRVGMVWLCIKRTIQALKSLLVKKSNEPEMLGEGFGSSLQSELEKLFDEKEETKPQEEPQVEEPEDVLDEEVITLDEAQARGLVVDDDVLWEESLEEEDASGREPEGF